MWIQCHGEKCVKTCQDISRHVKTQFRLNETSSGLCACSIAKQLMFQLRYVASLWPESWTEACPVQFVPDGACFCSFLLIRLKTIQYHSYDSILQKSNSICVCEYDGWTLLSSICLSNCPSTLLYQSISPMHSYLRVHPWIYIYQFVCLSRCLGVCVCDSIHSSIHPLIHLSILSTYHVLWKSLLAKVGLPSTSWNVLSNFFCQKRVRLFQQTWRYQVGPAHLGERLNHPVSPTGQSTPF